MSNTIGYTVAIQEGRHSAYMRGLYKTKADAEKRMNEIAISLTHEAEEDIFVTIGQWDYSIYIEKFEYKGMPHLLIREKGDTIYDEPIFTLHVGQILED